MSRHDIPRPSRRNTAGKGTNLSGIDPATGEIARLFHPRRDIWSEHCQWQDALLVGRTLPRLAVGQIRHCATQGKGNASARMKSLRKATAVESLIRRTAVVARPIVVDLKVEAGKRFGEVTVLTAESSSPPDEVDELPLHVRSCSGVLLLERKKRFGPQELNEPADVKVILKVLSFLVGQLTAPCFGGQFIGAAQISGGEFEGEDRAGCFRAPRFVVGSDRALEDFVLAIGNHTHAFLFTAVPPFDQWGKLISFSGRGGHG